MFDDHEIISDAILKNSFIREEKAKGMKVANWLLDKGLDRLVVRRDLTGKGPGFVLGNAGVEIFLTGETDAAQALAMVQSEPGKPGLEDFGSKEVGMQKSSAL